jgi:hypothetical protein
MEEAIHFRIIIWQRNNQFKAICLETKLTFQAETDADLHKKIKDGLISYLECFSEQEINAKSYLRPIPLKFRLLWQLKPLITWIYSLQPTSANYNLRSGELRFIFKISSSYYY